MNLIEFICSSQQQQSTLFHKTHSFLRISLRNSHWLDRLSYILFLCHLADNQAQKTHLPASADESSNTPPPLCLSNQKLRKYESTGQVSMELYSEASKLRDHFFQLCVELASKLPLQERPKVVQCLSHLFEIFDISDARLKRQEMLQLTVKLINENPELDRVMIAACRNILHNQQNLPSSPASDSQRDSLMQALKILSQIINSPTPQIVSAEEQTISFDKVIIQQHKDQNEQSYVLVSLADAAGQSLIFSHFPCQKITLTSEIEFSIGSTPRSPQLAPEVSNRMFTQFAGRIKHANSISRAINYEFTPKATHQRNFSGRDGESRSSRRSPSGTLRQTVQEGQGTNKRFNPRSAVSELSSDSKGFSYVVDKVGNIVPEEVEDIECMTESRVSNTEDRLARSVKADRNSKIEVSLVQGSATPKPNFDGSSSPPLKTLNSYPSQNLKILEPALQNCSNPLRKASSFSKKSFNKILEAESQPQEKVYNQIKQACKSIIERISEKQDEHSKQSLIIQMSHLEEPHIIHRRSASNSPQRTVPLYPQIMQNQKSRASVRLKTDFFVGDTSFNKQTLVNELYDGLTSDNIVKMMSPHAARVLNQQKIDVTLQAYNKLADKKQFKSSFFQHHLLGISNVQLSNLAKEDASGTELGVTVHNQLVKTCTRTSTFSNIAASTLTMCPENETKPQKQSDLQEKKSRRLSQQDSRIPQSTTASFLTANLNYSPSQKLHPPLQEARGCFAQQPSQLSKKAEINSIKDQFKSRLDNYEVSFFYNRANNLKINSQPVGNIIASSGIAVKQPVIPILPQHKSLNWNPAPAKAVTWQSIQGNSTPSFEYSSPLVEKRKSTSIHVPQQHQQQLIQQNQQQQQPRIVFKDTSNKGFGAGGPVPQPFIPMRPIIYNNFPATLRRDGVPAPTQSASSFYSVSHKQPRAKYYS